MNNEEKNAFYEKFESDLKRQQEEADKKIFVRRKGAAGETNNFLAKVERVMAEKKCGRGTAVKIVITENPELHQAWLAESQNLTNKER